MHTIVIEVNGGIVQTVYTDAIDLQIVLVDWDEGDKPKDAGDKLMPRSLSDLPKETRDAVVSL
jgi:hypothetical protein